MTNIAVILLCGIPGVGKTTFAKALKSYFTHYIVALYHYDEICQTFHSDERKAVVKLVELKCLDILNSKLNTKPHLIVIDDNNYYKSMRYVYLQLCRRLHLGFLIVFIDIPLELAMQQNSKRTESKRIPESVIRGMSSILEKPEGRHVLVINSDYDFDSIDIRIKNALEQPEKVEEPRTSAAMPLSLLQLIELTLRKVVNAKCKESKERAGELNCLKRQLFIDIKAGCVKLKVDEKSSGLEIEKVLSGFFD